MLKASSYAFFNNSRQKLNNYRNKKKKSNESARHRTGPNFQQDILVYQAIGVKDDLKQKKKKRRRPYIGVDSRTYDLEKVTWMTNKMSHDFKTDKAYITSNVAEFIMFLIFMIFPIVVALNQVPTLKFHQEKGLKRQLVYKPFKADHNSDKMYLFEDIRSRNFLFKYLNATMIQGEWLMQFYGQYSPQNQRQLTPIWYIVGHPQLRQIRVRKDSCNVHPVFRLFIKDCYDYFAPENEQREQIYPLKQVFMYDVYITRLYRDIHWKYREGRFSDSVTFDTNLGSYTGGGYVAELEAGPRGPNSNALLFTYLSDFVWLDRATRICLLEILVYNPHTNLMSAVKVFFEFPPTGGVFPRIDIKTAQVFHLLTAYDYFILGMLALLVAYSLYFIVEEARNIAYFRERFLFVFWSYIDIAIICVRKFF